MNRWMWTLFAGALACREEESDLDAISTAAEGDVAELAGLVDGMIPALAARGVAVDVDDEFPGVGDCVWRWSLTGETGDLAWAAAIDPAPCGGAYVGRRLRLDYAVTSGSLEGSIVKGADVWDYELAGARASEVTFQAARMDEPATYTADWTLDSLAGSTDGFEPGPFEASLTYTGWADGVWNLSVSRAADLSVSGTLTGPDGQSCTVSGSSADDVVVSCESETATP